MSDTIPATEDPATDAPGLEPVLAPTFANSTIATVLMDVETQPVPDDWRVLDGSQMVSAEWPEFVRAMGIAGPTFILPAPERTRPGYRYLIKLGRQTLLPPPPAPSRYQSLEQIMEAREALRTRRPGASA